MNNIAEFMYTKSGDGLTFWLMQTPMVLWSVYTLSLYWDSKVTSFEREYTGVHLHALCQLIWWAILPIWLNEIFGWPWTAGILVATGIGLIYVFTFLRLFWVNRRH